MTFYGRNGKGASLTHSMGGANFEGITYAGLFLIGSTGAYSFASLLFLGSLLIPISIKVFTITMPAMSLVFVENHFFLLVLI